MSPRVIARTAHSPSFAANCCGHLERHQSLDPWADIGLCTGQVGTVDKEALLIADLQMGPPLASLRLMSSYLALQARITTSNCTSRIRLDTLHSNW